MRPERIATDELRCSRSDEGRGESGGDLGELAKSAQTVSSLAKGIVANDQLGLAVAQQTEQSGLFSLVLCRKVRLQFR